MLIYLYWKNVTISSITHLSKWETEKNGRCGGRGDMEIREKEIQRGKVGRGHDKKCYLIYRRDSHK